MTVLLANDAYLLVKTGYDNWWDDCIMSAEIFYGHEVSCDDWLFFHWFVGGVFIFIF